MARVSVVVPTYNGAELLVKCLRTLAQSSYPDFDLVVVDDGSTIPVEPRVREVFPDATIIRHENNLGLTRGFNAGIDVTNSEFVVLLNDDTEVDTRWLAALVSCADRHPEAGSIASKLRLADDRQVLHSAGDTYSVRGMPGNRGVWMDDLGQYDLEEPVFGACAGAALYRRAALEDVCLPCGEIFDTRLFMYCEDVDLSWRLQRAGYSCIFAPQAVVYHHLSATGGGRLASYYVARNVWYVIAHNMPAEMWKRYRHRILAHHAGRLVKALRQVREPAARRQLAGTAAGIWYVIRNMQNPGELDPVTYDRVHGLLIDR